MDQLNEIELKKLIQKGECQTIEFKKSTKDISKDVYESICAFSNRNGGHILFGIKDNGGLIGLEQECIEKIKKDFVTAINNPSKLMPPLFLTIDEYILNEKKILHVYVPVGSQVSRQLMSR